MQKTVMLCAVISFLTIVLIGEFVLTYKLKETEDGYFMMEVIIVVTLIIAAAAIGVMMTF